MAKIKPLARPGFTMFNNYILDHIMPDLSPNGWKVLCVAIRRPFERISYAQFLEATAMQSRSTLARAIQQCLQKGYLQRQPSPEHSQGYDYFLTLLAPEATEEALEKRARKAHARRARAGYIQVRRQEFAKVRAQLALLLIHRDGYGCRYCGSQNDLTVDHITPLSKGGTDEPDNLQLLCRSCNSRKGPKGATE